MPAVFAAGAANVPDPPKEFTDLAIRMARGSVGFFAGAVAAWAQGRRRSATRRCWRSSRRPTPRGRGRAADFAAWLETDLLPRSNGTYAHRRPSNFVAKLRYEELVEHAARRSCWPRARRNLAKDYDAFVADGPADRPDEDARPR